MFKNIRTFFFIVLLNQFLFIESQSQPVPNPVKVTFYYNQSWELTSQENYYYRREAYFDLANLVFDGVYSDYNKDNKLIADGTYSQGLKSGIHTTYANDYSVKSKIEYSSNDDFTIWEWYSDDKTQSVKNGTGNFTINYYYITEVRNQLMWRMGKLTGQFQNGKKIGKWIYADDNVNNSDVEFYQRGKFIKHTHIKNADSIETNEPKSIYLSLSLLNSEVLMFDKNVFQNLNEYFEKYITYPPRFTRNVAYPGGIKRLLSLLSQEVYIAEQYLELVSIKVDEHGQPARFNIERSVNTTTDNETLQALMIHGKRLLPAMKNGVPQATTVYIPISGGKNWVETLQQAPTEWFLNPNNFLN